jgi:hypothetical protein
MENVYLDGFIDQFGPLGELDPDRWTALEFLEWLKLNKFEIIRLEELKDIKMS